MYSSIKSIKKDKNKKDYEFPTVDVATKFSCPKDLEISADVSVQAY